MHVKYLEFYLVIGVITWILWTQKIRYSFLIMRVLKFILGPQGPIGVDGKQGVSGPPGARGPVGPSGRDGFSSSKRLAEPVIIAPKKVKWAQ